MKKMVNEINKNIGATAFIIKVLRNKSGNPNELLNAMESLFEKESRECSFLSAKENNLCSYARGFQNSRQDNCEGMECPLAMLVKDELMELSLSIDS